jgi:VWFA-related protein
LTIGIIIDASESQREQVAEHRQTALVLLGRLLRAGDRALVVSVNQEVRLAADLSPSVPDLRRHMEEGRGVLLGTPCPARECGSSPSWNAVYDTARLKPSSIAGNKALLILTDGFDSGSPHTWRQAADEAERAETTVYAIQYQSKFGGHYTPDLYRLVEEAGGTWFPAAAGEFDAAVSRIETDLRRRYVLGVEPERLSGKLRHDIRVEVTRPDLTVRARKTYFQPE